MIGVVNVIYLDNAATSWPKPDSVYKSVTEAMKYKGGNPGRSAHKLSIAAGQVLEKTRFSLSRLFGIEDPKHIVFCQNATDALNLAINGVLKPGEHIITSSMEHNSVTRPIEYQILKGVECTKLKMDPVVGIDTEELKKAIKDNTRLVVITHASNVTGTINPIQKIGEICRNEKIVFLVDAAQTAGAVPIYIEKMGIDMLAFPGHKGLLGPLGTGGLYIAEGLDVNPLRFGGTGVFSDMKLQPDELPYRYESGTQNVHGLAGLNEGVQYILSRTVESIFEHEQKLTSLLTNELAKISGVSVYGYPYDNARSTAVSINIESVDCLDAAMILDTSFDIAVRSGLHCAPDAHITIGTAKTGGTIRASAGVFTTEDDIMRYVEAVKEITATV